jgi:hypothetical protein
MVNKDGYYAENGLSTIVLQTSLQTFFFFFFKYLHYLSD